MIWGFVFCCLLDLYLKLSQCGLVDGTLSTTTPPPHSRCTFPILLCVLEGRVSGAALMKTLVLWLTAGLNHGRHLE